MKVRLFHYRPSAGLALVGLILIGASWWYLQRSGCVADLKQGLGDVEQALSLEGRAFVLCAFGMLALTSGISMGETAIPNWLRIIIPIASFPIACGLFLAFGLLGGHSAWVCSL